MLFDDSVDNRQTESSSFSNAFGAEEGFKDARLSGRIHSTSSIMHSQTNKMSLASLGMIRQVSLVDLHERSADVQLSALWHCISRVDRQVHDHLLEHGAVGRDHRQTAPVVEFQDNF